MEEISINIPRKVHGEARHHLQGERKENAGEKWREWKEVEGNAFSEWRKVEGKANVRWTLLPRHTLYLDHH